MTAATASQRYNPEVPWDSQSQNTQLNELVDKLIKIRQSIGAAVSQGRDRVELQRVTSINLFSYSL